jgi:hypothetical protein
VRGDSIGRVLTLDYNKAGLAGFLITQDDWFERDATDGWLRFSLTGEDEFLDQQLSRIDGITIDDVLLSQCGRTRTS